MLDSKEVLLALNSILINHPFKTYKALLEHFGTAENILKQTESSLIKVPGIGKKIAHAITHWEENFDLKKEIQLIQKHKITLLFNGSPNYPHSLSQIYDPPLLVYCKGTLKNEDQASVGIVGARAATRYGKETTYQLAKDLAQRGWTVVSGLAWGIDTQAHLGALEGNGRTLAVIGHGLAYPLYPPENDELAERILAQGAILSEFPMSFASLGRNFPRRNRIIAGLSQGVLIAEAAQRSGALITADFAMELGRPVMALPGPIDSPVSLGTNKLIQDGAKLVLEVSDIIEELTPHFGTLSQNEANSKDPKPAKNRLNPPLTQEEEKIYNHITHNEIQLEKILEDAGLDHSQATLALFSLEIKNLVKQLPGQYYVRS